jgi:predicted CopG family antitoxin
LEKTIKVSEEAYNRLTASKRRGETFTDVILREIQPQEREKNIMKLFGAWKGDEEEFNTIFGYLLKGERNTLTRTPEALEWSA